MVLWFNFLFPYNSVYILFFITRLVFCLFLCKLKESKNLTNISKYDKQIKKNGNSC